MAAPNPLSLIAMGVGTLGSLVGGVTDAFGAAERKRRFLEDEKRKAQVTALRNQRFGRFKGFFPTNAYDAKYKQEAVEREADENPRYNANPMSLLPFVGNATALAGGIYDYAKTPSQYDSAVKNALALPKVEDLNDPPPTPTPAYLLPAPGTEDPEDEPQRMLASGWNSGSWRYG